MSLLRLLTTGKSLVGVRDKESPYRLTNQRLLPQFGPAKNPFSSSRESEPAQTEERSAPNDAAPDAARNERGGTSVWRVMLAALRLRAAALLSGCKGKLNNILGRVRPKAVKPAIPRFTKPAVQGELSLDRIKVVRNDLSDADLEVVPAKAPSAVASPGPASLLERKDGLAESGWGRATARLFGAGKT
jgi:hypothetical protein